MQTGLHYGLHFSKIQSKPTIINDNSKEYKTLTINDILYLTKYNQAIHFELPKLQVASSNLVSRSPIKPMRFSRLAAMLIGFFHSIKSPVETGYTVAFSSLSLAVN
ncbi:hypothetical protein [Spirosoma panaciterrae]|uniref:hypothetical protein n=1 Tax=Spirosoma panaciterrae TaxID=496058 RepID=UPI0003755F4B|nr:hypothetical protein [Spirosoma panaciterrae]